MLRPPSIPFTMVKMTFASLETTGPIVMVLLTSNGLIRNAIRGMKYDWAMLPAQTCVVLALFHDLMIESVTGIRIGTGNATGTEIGVQIMHAIGMTAGMTTALASWTLRTILLQANLRSPARHPGLPPLARACSRHTLALVHPVRERIWPCRHGFPPCLRATSRFGRVR